MDLADLVSYHQLSLAVAGRTKATQKQYFYFHGVFLDYLQQAGLPAGLDALSARNLRGAALWYANRPDRRRTRNGEVGTRALVDLVKRLATFAEDEGIIDGNHLRKVGRVRITEHSPEPFSSAEVNALWGATHRSTLPLRDEALVLLLLDTGMRIGEACGLTVDRLRLDGEERSVLVGAVGKGRRERRVPLGDPQKRDGGRTVRALRAWLQERGPDTKRSGPRVFLGKDGYPLTPAGGNDLFHRLGKQTGVESCHPHRARHTFCSWYLVQFPGDEIGLRRIVGHMGRKTLERYVHLADSIVAQRRQGASMVEGLGGAYTARR